MANSISNQSDAPMWPIRTCEIERIPSLSALEGMGKLLKVIHCLPGSGELIVIVDSEDVTTVDLPFAGDYVSPAVRTVLSRAMLIGGGCAIRINTAHATLVFGVCMRLGSWRGYSGDQVRKFLSVELGEMAVSFPAEGSIEPLNVREAREDEG